MASLGPRTLSAAPPRRAAIAATRALARVALVVFALTLAVAAAQADPGPDATPGAAARAVPEAAPGDRLEAAPEAVPGTEPGAEPPEEARPLPRPEPDAALAAPTEPTVEVALEDGAIVLREDGRTAWRWRPARAAGEPTAPVVVGDEVQVGLGLYLLTLDAQDGTVVARTALPAPAATLEGELEDATTPGADPVRFAPAADAFRALRRAADSVPDPEAAYARDPTDPWLALRLALDEAPGEARDALLAEAAERAAALPFFESAPLATALLEAGDEARFEATMEAALADLAARGYDPRLLTDPTLRSAYGLPHDALVTALDQGDTARARTLAPYAWRLAAEEAPETVAALDRLAQALRAAGDRASADLWRDRARDLRRAGLTTWVDVAASSLARLGWWGVAGLAAAFAALWIVLAAKVWRAQTLARRQRRERGQATPLAGRLWVPRHASTTEKAVLVALLVLTGVQAVLAGWDERASEVPVALRSGTLASTQAVAAVRDLPDGRWASLVRGLSALQRGDAAAATDAWDAADATAPALVNLAVASDDAERREARLEAALRLDPREPVARWMTGRADDPSPFHAEVTPGAPLWSVPSPLELRLAVAGDWRTTLREAFTAPWRALPAAAPAALPAWAWWPILAAWAALTLALLVAVVVPRPRVSKDAPRTPAYHLGALLVPGAGHADELWGLLLLVPWALFGTDALLAWRDGAGALGPSLRTTTWILAGLYAANLVGFVVEAASYRRRMWLLRERKPELARSYGLPAAPPPPTDLA